MKNKALADIVCTVLVVAGFVALLIATRNGIGLSPDSIAYIGGSRSILVGDGFSIPPDKSPVTHVAPFYPHLLASLGLTGMDPVEGARWLAAGLLGLNLFLIYRLTLLFLEEMVETGGWIQVGVVALALVSKPLWDIHLMAWTEPLFLSLGLMGLWLMAICLRDSSRGAFLLAAGFVVALAILTRYAGLSLWVAFCGILLLFGERSLLGRIRDLFLFSVVSLVPFLGWSIKNYLSAGTATNRAISFHPAGIDHMRQALDTCSSWWAIPIEASGITKLGPLVATLVLLVLGTYLWARSVKRVRLAKLGTVIPSVIKAVAVTAVVYPLFLVLSISLVDGNTPLDQRILSPQFVFTLILVAFGFAVWNDLIGRRRLLRLGLVLLLGVGIFAQLRVSLPVIADSYYEGIGFNNVRWRESELIGELKALEPEGPMYSNSPGAVYFHTGKGAKKIPASFSKVTQKLNPDYERARAELDQALGKGGLLVFFELGDSPLKESVERLIVELNLESVSSHRDGEIYSR